MTTRPLLTNYALIALLAQDELCPVCHGTGRIKTGRHTRTCGSCRGRGVPDDWYLDPRAVSRDEWKALREAR